MNICLKYAVPSRAVLRMGMQWLLGQRMMMVLLRVSNSRDPGWVAVFDTRLTAWSSKAPILKTSLGIR